MAVITKYVVVRNGVELDREFRVKKEADAYDRMLDAAENLAAYIKDADLELKVEDPTIEAISVFLAQNGPEVMRILKNLKPVPPAARVATKDEADSPVSTAAKRTKAARTKAKGN